MVYRRSSWPKKLPNEMKLKLHAKIYHGKLGTSSVKFCGISAESRTARRALVWRFSAIPGSFEVRAANSDPARLHYGPEVFAWTLRALSGVLKASSGAAPLNRCSRGSKSPTSCQKDFVQVGSRADRPCHNTSGSFTSWLARACVPLQSVGNPSAPLSAVFKASGEREPLLAYFPVELEEALSHLKAQRRSRRSRSRPSEQRLAPGSRRRGKPSTLHLGGFPPTTVPQPR